MTSHPGPFTVSNLRHYRQRRTFSVMLALIGTVACGGESPVSPGPQAAAPPRDMKAPATASFLSYLTPEAQAQAEVRALETEARSMNSAVGTEGLTLSSTTGTVGIFGPKKKGASKPALDPTVGTNLWATDPCKLDYIECVYQCLYTRMQFQTATADFWRADNEFWENTLTGRWYLNTLQGGPQDQMSNGIYWMRFHFGRFRAMNCSSYL